MVPTEPRTVFVRSALYSNKPGTTEQATGNDRLEEQERVDIDEISSTSNISSEAGVASSSHIEEENEVEDGSKSISVAEVLKSRSPSLPPLSSPRLSSLLQFPSPTLRPPVSAIPDLTEVLTAYSRSRYAEPRYQTRSASKQAVLSPPDSGLASEDVRSSSAVVTLITDTFSTVRLEDDPLTTWKKVVHPFKGGKGVTRWYQSTGEHGIAKPPADCPAMPGDIYIHADACISRVQYWLRLGSQEWIPVEQGANHPILDDRRLWFRSPLEPSWITKKSYSTYSGNYRRQELWESERI
ncbi:hypothetical protein NM688_g6907 [Phlebia brevispora]|uniref:Uncharacterized protein n=1 Tax=Phlebia brevispora TaxID=194682 RepID=A0ACC1SBG5_9APHY|nr:hypothetical protein NM688_g6907 [Phlebia brevispora]